MSATERKSPMTKSDFYRNIVEELNLDVRDNFTLLLANAFALNDQRDYLQSELAAATARIAELEAAIYTDSSAVVARLEAENKRLREPMPEQVCNDLIDEWLDKDPKWVDLVRRAEAWHANK